MHYSVVFMAGESLKRIIPWDGTLESAIAHAVTYMKIRKADHVEVRDMQGRPVFRHPENSGFRADFIPSTIGDHRDALTC